MEAFLVIISLLVVTLMFAIGVASSTIALERELDPDRKVFKYLVICFNLMVYITLYSLIQVHLVSIVWYG